MFDYAPFIAGLVPRARPPVAAVERLTQYLSPGGCEAGVPGDLRLRMVEQQLDCYPNWTRSKEQRTFHVNFVNACLPHFYGADWSRHRSRVMQARGLAELDQLVVVSTPRRFGKTTAIAMLNAALLLFVPFMHVSVFSPGQRVSTELLRLSKMFFEMSDTNVKIQKHTGEQLFVGPDKRDVRRLYCYPSGVASLKGVGGKVIILEEAAVLPVAIMQEVVVPLLRMKDSTMLGISTVKGDENFFSTLFEMKDEHDHPIFKSIAITRVCAPCHALGLSECAHAAQAPSWHSSQREMIIKKLMENDADLYTNEAVGIVTTTNQSALDPEAVARFTRRVFPGYTVYTIVDPNGGGPSDCAVGSFGLSHGALVVIAFDTMHVTTDKSMEEFLKSHAANVQSLHPTAQLVVVIERNFGGTPLSSRIADILEVFAPVKFLTADPTKHRQVGTVTTNNVKLTGRIHMQRHLRDGAVGYAHDFISCSKNMKEKVGKQLANFKYIVRETADTKRIKLSGKSYGSNDDAAMIFILACYWIPYCLDAHESALL